MLSAIVVIAENGAIGKNGDLLCHLPADLKHFKEITMGNAIIMGRRTFQSLPKGALPGRRNIVISHNPAFDAPGAEVFTSLNDAIKSCYDYRQQPFIIGGGQLYEAAFNLVDTLYLTLIHASFPDADTFFPNIDYSLWSQTDRIDHCADVRNPFDFSFITLVRK